MNPLVSVTIVTHNSRKFIETCLESVYKQSYSPLEIVIVENASTDGTAELLETHEQSATVVRNTSNSGFAAGQNQAIGLGHGEWVLTLNPDVRLQPDFIERLVEGTVEQPTVGAVCGRLLRATPSLGIPLSPRLDSTGIYFTPSLRHFDRGWDEPDDGRYGQREYVFGACAAAALYRRTMIEEVSIDGCFFDPDFFAYREDADVAWRAQLIGWRCLYLPNAIGHHVRRVIPGHRTHVPPVLRMHSVKNRFLMRLKNVTGDLYFRHLLPVAWRDVLVIGACVLSERTSFPGLWRALRQTGRALAQRREIMNRRRATDAYIASWFHDHPTSEPLEALASDADLAQESAVRDQRRLPSRRIVAADAGLSEVQ